MDGPLNPPATAPAPDTDEADRPARCSPSIWPFGETNRSTRRDRRFAGGVAAHHCVGYPAGVSRVLHDLTPHLMSQPGFVHGELDQPAAELECLLHSRR